jgi:hypothetical protein
MLTDDARSACCDQPLTVSSGATPPLITDAAYQKYMCNSQLSLIIQNSQHLRERLTPLLEYTTPGKT